MNKDKEEYWQKGLQGLFTATILSIYTCFFQNEIKSLLKIEILYLFVNALITMGLGYIYFLCFDWWKWIQKKWNSLKKNLGRFFKRIRINTNFEVVVDESSEYSRTIEENQFVVKFKNDDSASVTDGFVFSIQCDLKNVFPRKMKWLNKLGCRLIFDSVPNNVSFSRADDNKYESLLEPIEPKLGIIPTKVINMYTNLEDDDSAVMQVRCVPLIPNIGHQVRPKIRGKNWCCSLIGKILIKPSGCLKFKISN